MSNEIYIMIYRDTDLNEISVHPFYCLDDAKNKIRELIGRYFLDLATDYKKIPETLKYLEDDLQKYSFFSEENATDGFVECYEFGNRVYEIYRKPVE